MRVILLTALSIFACTMNADEIELDLRGAVSMALARVPEFDSKRLQKNISELNLSSSTASFFPKISLQASSSINSSFPTWIPSLGNSLGISFHQPLLSTLTNSVSHEIARAKVDLADAELKQKRDELCMTVLKAYIAYSAAMAARDIQQGKYRTLQTQRDVVNRRFLQGLKTERDVSRFQAQVQQAQIQVAHADSRVTRQKNALIAAVGGAAPSATLIFSPIVPNEDLLNDIPDTAPKISQHPLILKLEIDKKLAALDVDLAKRKLWPELSLSASATGSANFFFHPPNTAPGVAFMIGINLGYNLFDFGISRRDVVIAGKEKAIKANMMQAELIKERSAIDDMMNNFSLYKTSLTLNKNLLTLEQRNLQRIEHDYAQGKSQYLDLINALNSTNDAKATLIAELYELETLLATYRYYEGSLYDWIF